VRLGDGTIVENRAWIPDRYTVERPFVGQRRDLFHHLLRRHFGPGRKLAPLGFAARQYLDVRTADIDCQHAHLAPPGMS
jgi:hypothetical protein